MKSFNYLIIFTIVIALGCCDKPDKCNNQCGDRAVCDENGICQPKTSGDFYNPKTGKYERFFYIGFETFPNCFYYNYSYIDTPWIFPSLLDINGTNRFNAVDLNSLTIDSFRNLYEDKNVSHYDLTFNRDANNRVTDINIIYAAGGIFSNDIFFDFNLAKKYQDKHVVSSWVGKVSSDRKRIDFTIYFYVNRTEKMFEDSDTVKIIKRSYTVHPECRSDCRFCFSCE